MKRWFRGCWVYDDVEWSGMVWHGITIDLRL
jgi:hypothetical protein